MRGRALVAAPQSTVSGSGSGHFLETNGPFFLSLERPITCMRVEGNLASVKYRFKRASGPGAPPQRGGQSVDRVATEPPQPPGAFDAAAGVCTDPHLNPAWTPLESGDFDVFDAG